MQKVTTDEINQDLLEHWRAGEVPHVDGFVFSSGAVTLLTSYTLSRGATVRCYAGLLADTTLASLLQYDQSLWVQVTTLASLSWTETTEVVCGEGPMGNEGFVAATDSREHRLLWVLFSTCSNPFTALTREGNCIIAEAGYDQSWRIPFADPVNFSIVDS